MEALHMVKNYIRYIMTHRQFHRNFQRTLKRKYILSIRIIMTLEYTFHDLNKIFTPKFFDYMVAYDPIIRCEKMDISKFNKVSMHDIWLTDARPSSKSLYSHIFKLMEENNGFNHKYLDLVAETLIEMSKHFGEDHIAVYLRNYYQFKLNEDDRCYFEDILGIDFDDYADDIPDLSIEDIMIGSDDKSLKEYIVYSLLNNHGVNILEVLGIDESYIK